MPVVLNAYEAVCSQSFGLVRGGFFLDAANSATGLLTLLSGAPSYSVIRKENGEIFQVIESTPVDLIDLVGRAAVGILSALFVAPFLIGLAYKYVHYLGNQELYRRILVESKNEFRLSLHNLARVPKDILSETQIRETIAAIPTSHILIDEFDTLILREWDQFIDEAIGGGYEREVLKTRLREAIRTAEDPNRDDPIPFIREARVAFRNELQQYLKLIVALLRKEEVTVDVKIATLAALYRGFGVCQPTWIRVTRAIIDQQYLGTNAHGKWLRAVQHLKNHTVEQFSQEIVHNRFAPLRDMVHHHLHNELLNKLEYHIHPDMSVARRDRHHSQVSEVSNYFTVERCLEEFYRRYSPSAIGETLEIVAFEQFNEESEEERELITEAMKQAIQSGDMMVYWSPPPGWTPPVAGELEEFDESYDRLEGVFRTAEYFASGHTPLFQNRSVVMRGCAAGLRFPVDAIPIQLLKPHRENFERESEYMNAQANYEREVAWFAGACLKSCFNFSVGESAIPNVADRERYPEAGRAFVQGYGKQLAALIGVIMAPMRE